MNANTLVSIVLSIIFISGIAAASTDPVELLELRAAAEEAYEEGAAATAVSLFRRLTEVYPDDPEVWYGLSRAHEWEGEVEQAIEAGERVQALGYASSGYLSYRLARLHALAGNPDEALGWIEIALAERYEERPGIQSDEAFVGLREDPRFIKLAGILPAEIDNRTDGIRFDVDYAVAEAQRMHAGPDRPAWSAEFSEAAAALKASAGELSDAEVYLGFMRLLAILGDGHSAIYAPDPDTPLQQVSPLRLPHKFYWFEEGLFIVDGLDGADLYAGSRVLRFGDLTAEDTLERMSAYRGVDNPMSWRWMGPQFYLGSLQMLQAVGATPSAASVAMTLEDADGNLTTLDFDGGMYAFQRKLRPSPAVKGEIPLYLRNVDVEQWMQSLPAQDALYFQFNQVRDGEDQTIAEFAVELKERLANEKVTSLIIDVRHNNGGNNSRLKPLIKVLIGFEQEAPEKRIFVITGRNTFSAAQNFINRLERFTDAIFVGEPSAASPNFVGEETGLLLPYSRLRGSISTRYWQDSDPGDDRAWITPVIPVPPTAADYFAGRDAAMDAILAVITANADR